MMEKKYSLERETLTKFENGVTLELSSDRKWCLPNTRHDGGRLHVILSDWELNASIPQINLENAIGIVGTLERHKTLDMTQVWDADLGEMMRVRTVDEGRAAPDHVWIDRKSELKFVGMDREAIVGKGNYAVSPGFRTCDAFIIEGLSGRLGIRHVAHTAGNYKRMKEFSDRCIDEFTGFKRIVVVGREPWQLANLVNEGITYIDKNRLFVGNIEEEHRGPFRFWGHVSNEGEAVWQVTTGGQENTKIAMPLSNYTER
jgi:hypothetical protein